MSERRFTDAEVAKIIERATLRSESPAPVPVHRSGLTLAEVQEIAREVGLDPASVAAAARTVDESPATTRPGLLGLPLRVERIIPLGREVSDAEWERMVVDLRDTFDARGRTRDEGSFRQWSNGNLQAWLEPAEGGHRVRLRTVKGDARPRIIVGMAFFLIPATVIAVTLATRVNYNPAPLVSLGAIGAASLALLGATALGVRRWAAERRGQMNRLAERWLRG
jgi:hypothetical protein